MTGYLGRWERGTSHLSIIRLILDKVHSEFLSKLGRVHISSTYTSTSPRSVPVLCRKCRQNQPTKFHPDASSYDSYVRIRLPGEVSTYTGKRSLATSRVSSRKGKSHPSFLLKTGCPSSLATGCIYSISRYSPSPLYLL